MPNSDTILVLGSNGQIGTELVLRLRKELGADRVVSSDITFPRSANNSDGPFEIVDVLDKDQLLNVVEKYRVTQIYHLAALLSATSEKNPKFAWRLNIDGLLNVLDLAVEKKIKKVFWPSSIAVFGPGTPRDQTPQDTVMDPNTVYGISKLAGERWCNYYFSKFGLDVRSIRYPGLISYKTEPGGGTTDYAVHIFYDALRKHTYESFLSENTYLPMMYMPDAVRGTIDLMNTDVKNVKIRSGYNFAGFSFSPKELVMEIKRRIPDFTCTYKSDFRQQLADSWPRSIDDTAARSHWGWTPEFTLRTMTEDMLMNLGKQIPNKIKI